MDIFEKDARLRYFYLIDTDNLATKISSTLTSLTSPDDIFDTVFSKIEDACNNYLEFIWSKNSFNTPRGDHTLSSHDVLLRMVLKHHCILHGFLSAVAEDSKNRNSIGIRGQNDFILKQGYFYTNYFNTTPPNTQNSTNFNSDSSDCISQSYNQYKKRFNRYSEIYSYYILKTLYQNSKDGFLEIPRYKGNWGCFIYTDPAVLTFDKNIDSYINDPSHKNSTYSCKFLTNYNKLFHAYRDWYHKNNLSLEDKLLFESAMEPIYGFQFFFYALKLIHRIHTESSKDTDMSLKDLEGQITLNLIQQTAQLPVIYNRSVFLEHAISSVLASKFLNSQDYQENCRSLFSTTSRKPSSKISLLSTGQMHMESYLQKLKHVALPLLEDLWDVITYKLNDNTLYTGSPCINMETYRTYIQKNYAAMSADYTWYFENEERLHGLNEDYLYQKAASENIETMYQSWEFLSSGNKSSTSLQKQHSSYERNSFQHLLFDYFKKERFTVQQKDLYQQLMSPFSTDSIEDISKHTNILNFQKYHRENIFSFAESLTSYSQ